MKAILIDPWQRSLETIDIPNETVPSLIRIRELVGENCLDFAYIRPGEAIAVGDSSALQNPPLPFFIINGYKFVLFGRGVVVGHTAHGKERDTALTVDELSKMIKFR